MTVEQALATIFLCVIALVALALWGDDDWPDLVDDGSRPDLLDYLE